MKSQILAIALSALAINAASASEITLESEKDKLSYGLGMMIGERILKNYGEIDYDLLLEGMKNQAAGGELQMTMEEAQMAIQAEMQRAAEEKTALAVAKGAAYLEENKAREGVSVTDSGLQYEVITAAEGAKPELTDTVRVHYVGTLIDGSEFDSSISRGEPTEFSIKGVIPGWTEGLQLMSVGSKYRFVIPSELAYGERGAGNSIGPGETLIFEVELLDILAP